VVSESEFVFGASTTVAALPADAPGLVSPAIRSEQFGEAK
jgi:hypothetical protein